jgi:methyltransferase (TIGR00027 family)
MEGDRIQGGMVTGVSRTAIGVAWLRAQERLRPDRLFDDPYAADFVIGAREVTERAREEAGDQGRKIGALFGLQVVVRTRFYDDYLLTAAAGGVRQVVLLAAGLDTRAFRLDWPDGVRLFELDLPELLDFKERILASRSAVARCERVVLPADLRADWVTPLTEAGFRPEEPTAWLVEGLLVYLSAEEATRLLTTVTELSAPGSRISCEHRDDASESLMDRVRETPEMAHVLAMWKGGLGRELGGWLTRNGWHVETFDANALAKTYDRTDLGEAPAGFITATR